MKVFHDGNHINFVDKNNVWVAYEKGDWDIEGILKPKCWCEYVFDLDYFDKNIDCNGSLYQTIYLI